MPSLCRASRLSHTSLNPQEHVLHQWVMSPVGLAARTWELQPREIYFHWTSGWAWLRSLGVHSTSKGLGMRLGRLTRGCCWLLLSQPVVLRSSAVPLERSFLQNYDAEIFHDTKLQGLQLLQVSPHSLPPPLVSKKKKSQRVERGKQQPSISLPFGMNCFWTQARPCAIPLTSLIGWSWKGPAKMHTIPRTPSPQLPDWSVRSQTSAVDQAKYL